MELECPCRIEDYALIGNLHTSALVHKNGCIDWMCLPRFDSGAVFARLIGKNDNGYWRLAPADEKATSTRSYDGESLVLKTRFETATGIVDIVDFMPVDPPAGEGDLVRIVEGVSGSVEMEMTLFLRFDYGSAVPWVQKRADGIHAVSGPYAVRLRAPVPLEGENMHTVAKFTVGAGDSVPFLMSWTPSHHPEPPYRNAARLRRKTQRWWKKWAGGCAHKGEYRAAVVRSLITLKALTHAGTGGIVAAVTTSLPESIGGQRNWDYRYCWVRDASFTLDAFLRWGHTEEIGAWRNWLLRAAGGKPEDLQIMYGIGGERRLPEMELTWLEGFCDSKPVRIGNAASQQRQIDVYGELSEAMSLGRRLGLKSTTDSWNMARVMRDYLETIWEQPDSGLWEMRGHPRHFTYSKIMAWVAFDRAVDAIEKGDRDGPLEKWRALRDRIHADVCEKGFDKQRNTFVQSYGSAALDASLLRIPIVGFLPPDDPRVIGTVEAIQRELMTDGFVQRYKTEEADDGLPPGEGVFLACTFWLADALIAIGRREQGKEIFDRLLAIGNDVGLLAEEYDPQAKRQLGNFPQAFSHVGLLLTARNLLAPEEIGPLRS
jgi:GH15 family glucan-1,4-alpha-glucosidase